MSPTTARIAWIDWQVQANDINVEFTLQNGGCMKLRLFIGFLLLSVLSTLAGCGGSNVVSNSTDGTLSVESVVAPTSPSSQGAVSVKLIAPTGGPGTGTISITSGNPTLLSFSPANQSVNSDGKATFLCTANETVNDTIVPFTVSVGSLSLTREMTISGTGAISLVITAPASADTAGTITATFANGSQSAGRKTTISSDLTDKIAFDTVELPADATGKAIFSYRVINITADTTIIFTAKSGIQSVVKSIQIPVNIINPPPIVINPEVNSIAFVSTSPTTISIKGAGGAGRTETSIVSFIVRDVTGQPLAGQTVDFTLDTTVGGTTLIPISTTSDSAGVAKTIVNAGIVSGPVTVTATIRSKSISIKSGELIISTGLPHQDGLSISMSTVNPEGLVIDGIIVPVTTMLSDHFGNPVPDGTAVYFTCYGGSIEPSATTKNGISTVNWRSQNPRPVDGKAKILVYSIGEESFTDLNGNGLADAGEFTDIGEPFLAISGSTIRDSALDPFIDFNGDNTYNSGDGKFNGLLQGIAYTGAPRSLYVFKNSEIIMSGSIPLISPGKLTITKSSTAMRTFTISDENGNSLPGKTTISLSLTAESCLKSVTPSNFTVNSITNQNFYGITIVNNCTADGSDYLNITVKTPNGIESRETILVTYN
jgi:hypothetical protein